MLKTPLRATQYNSIITRKIHFIWMGKDLPEKYLRNIGTFSFQNPDYEINLWSNDKKRFERPMLALDLKNPRWKLRNINELDIDGKYARWVDWELTGTLANFAAASDILRLLILFKEGGIYTDTDNTALRPFGTLLAKYGFLVAMSSRDQNSLTNAMMASVPGNPYIQEISEFVLDQYERKPRWYDLQRKRHPGSPERRRLTIEMSGPGAISSALEHYGQHQTTQRRVPPPRGSPKGTPATVRTGRKFVQDLLFGGFAPHHDIRFPPGLVHVASDQTWLGSTPRAAELP